MAYNTGNASGSTHPKDLIDNAEDLDLLLTGAGASNPNRLGVSLKSWKGIEQQVTDYLIAQAYEATYLVYGGGVVVERQTQLVQRDGELYRVMNAADIPLTLTGTWATDAPKLQAVGDAALRQQLSAESGGAFGASLIGGGVQTVGTAAELRALYKLSPSKYAKVCGWASKGDGWEGLYYLDPSDISSAENKAGTVIVANDGARWKSVDRSPQIPVIGEAINLVGTGYDLKYPADNILKNSSFYIWHETGPAPLPTGLAQNVNAIVCAQWRMETVGAGTTVTAIQKIVSPVGGLRFVANFGASLGFVYVRQNVLGVQPFSKKILVATVDIEVDVVCDLDFYARMRINALNDDASRPLVVDTANISLSPGRQTVSVVMQCPDVSAFLGLENTMQSFEYAFRLSGINSSVNVKVYGASIAPGRVARAAGSQDPLRDAEDAEVHYETGTVSVVGLSSTSGQKRLGTNFRMGKYRQPVVTLADRVGTPNRITTYDSAGTPTDGVSGYLVDITTRGIQVILSSSTAAGIYYEYAANSYF